MAKRANRTCYTCGKEYYFCPNCPNETRTEVFYHMFCCEHCSKIFKLLTDETFKHITTKQCKDELVKLGVSPNEKFKECINRHIKEVFNNGDLVIEVVNKSVVEPANEPVKEIMVEPTVESAMELDKPAIEPKNETIENCVVSEDVVHETEPMEVEVPKIRYGKKQKNK